MRPSLIQQIKITQLSTNKVIEWKNQIQEGRSGDFVLAVDGPLYLKNRLFVPEYGEMRDTILKEAHGSAFFMHIGSAKMYADLKP